MNEQTVAMMFNMAQTASAVLLVGAAWMAAALAVGIGVGRAIAWADARLEQDLARRSHGRRP